MYIEDDRLSDVVVGVGETFDNMTNSLNRQLFSVCKAHAGAAGASVVLNCTASTAGRYVAVWRSDTYSPNTDPLALCELEVYGAGELAIV